MNRAPLIFLTAFLAFAVSFGLFVLAPQVQIGRQSLSTVVGGSEVYPKTRSGQAHQGAEIYRAEGCAACHSQQVRQRGVRIDVVLKEFGTNQAAVIEEANKLYVKYGKALLADMPQIPLIVATNRYRENYLPELPQTVWSGWSSGAPHEAQAAQKALTKAGAKAEVQIVSLGSDIERGWGLRRSVAADYLYDSPVLLGSQRIGPDLANVGARLPDANWHLLHLYNPKITSKDSLMPPYRFLFTTRKIIFAPSPDALQLPKEFAPPAGHEVVPTEKARALVAYLQSLNVAVPLFEAPMTPPPAPPSTNDAAK